MNDIDEEIPREEMEAAFKTLKKKGVAAIMKIYDDGGVKLIDNVGVITVFQSPTEFLRYARKHSGEE